MNTKELNTFEKLIVKIQTGSWDDLACLSLTLERNFSLVKKPTKNDRKVHEEILRLIEERKAELAIDGNIKNIHRKEIKSMVPHKGNFTEFYE